MEKLSSIELINHLKNIQDIRYEQKYSKVRKIFIGLITPEWFHSNSTILTLDSKSWKRLDKSNLVNRLAAEFYHDLNVDYEDNFEKSFSSWYQPYHIIKDDKWGIHMRIDSLNRITKRFFKYYSHSNTYISNSLKAAFIYIYLHHLFHNLVENFTSIMEIKYNVPTVYLDYYSEIYSKTLHSSFCIEEVLANRFLIEHMKKYKINKEFLEEQILNLKRNQPHYFNSIDEYSLQKELILKIQKNFIKIDEENIKQIIEYINNKNIDQNAIPVWIHKSPKPLF